MTRRVILATLADRYQREPDRIGRDLTPAQVEAWVNAQVTDMASAKAMMVRLAIEVARLRALVLRNGG